MMMLLFINAKRCGKFDMNLFIGNDCHIPARVEAIQPRCRPKDEDCAQYLNKRL